MKVVIFGMGFLGSKLFTSLSKEFAVSGATLNPKQSFIRKVDASNKNEVEDFLISIKPDIVINTIALSSYLKCEQNSELCNKLNYITAVNISEVCNKINSKLIFISSSYIFDGIKGNYTENDIGKETNKYATSKIRAEKKVLEIEGTMVLRLECMYGYDEGEKRVRVGTNTFKNEMNIGYSDILRAPIFVDDVAQIVLQLIQNNQSGIFNLAGEFKITWLDFLNKLAALENAEKQLKVVDNSDWIIVPPHDTSLNIKKIISLGLRPTKFDSALEKIRLQIKDNSKSSKISIEL
jgi:dTDP-4-dehydrorhamnose reductase